MNDGFTAASSAVRHDCASLSSQRSRAMAEFLRTTAFILMVVTVVGGAIVAIVMA